MNDNILKDSWFISGTNADELVNEGLKFDDRTTLIPCNRDDISVLHYIADQEDMQKVYLLSKEAIKNFNEGVPIKPHLIKAGQIEDSFFESKIAFLLKEDEGKKLISIPSQTLESIERGKGLGLMGPSLARSMHLAGAIYKNPDLINLLIRTDGKKHKLFYAGSPQFHRAKLSDFIRNALFMFRSGDLLFKNFLITNQMTRICFEFPEWGEELKKDGIPLIPGIAFFCSDTGFCKYEAYATIRADGEDEPIYFPEVEKLDYKKSNLLPHFFEDVKPRLMRLLEVRIGYIKSFNKPIKRESIFERLISPFVCYTYGIGQVKDYISKVKDIESKTYVDEMIKVFKLATDKDIKIYSGHDLRFDVLKNIDHFLDTISADLHL